MTVQGKAIVFSQNGNPSEVLQPHSYTLPEPEPNQLLLQLLAAPINPADRNTILGHYPWQPKKTTELGTKHPSAVAGNEGLFKVVSVGAQVKELKKGDWVMPRIGGFGTWRTHALATENELYKLPNDGSLSVEQLATIAINPVTAWQMLHEVELKPGDYLIQNAANSVVGRYAIQFARDIGVKSINVVRNRPDIEQLKADLKSLGATEVITEEEIIDKKFVENYRKQLGEETNVKVAFNCVGGDSAMGLINVLSNGGYSITYGDMAKEPLMLDVSLLTFRDLHCQGYWCSMRARNDPLKRYNTVLKIIEFYKAGKIKDAPFTVRQWTEDQSEEAFFETFKTALETSGSKQILKF